MSVDEMKGRLSSLQNELEVFVKDLKNLEKKYENGEIGEEEYEEKKNVIERSLVELMDRLSQMKFILGDS
ncbi:SHOCT domain-containing protein [Candidatus Bathyarchaeota archaeon]|nr:SHOCT domain-containing protein [Candidatus Bathyarchaeota archaeon]